jgi:hypothetical protein
MGALALNIKLKLMSSPKALQSACAKKVSALRSFEATVVVVQGSNLELGA